MIYQQEKKSEFTHQVTGWRSNEYQKRSSTVALTIVKNSYLKFDKDYKPFMSECYEKQIKSDIVMI